MQSWMVSKDSVETCEKNLQELSSISGHGKEGKISFKKSRFFGQKNEETFSQNKKYGDGSPKRLSSTIMKEIRL